MKLIVIVSFLFEEHKRSINFNFIFSQAFLVCFALCMVIAAPAEDETIGDVALDEVASVDPRDPAAVIIHKIKLLKLKKKLLHG